MTQRNERPYQALAADRVAEPLPLSRMALDGIPAILHGLPLLQDLVDTPREVPQFTPARFLVRLRSKAVQACSGRSTGYEAVLLAVSKEGVTVVFAHER